MRVLFLHKYDRQAAAYRYRFEQYFPYFRSLGWQVSAQSLLESSYLTEKFSNQSVNLVGVFKSYCRRIWFLWKLKDTDFVVVYMEALPYLPFFFEFFLLLRRIPYAVDLDDAIFLNYKNHPNYFVRTALGSKFDRIFSRAACIFAGNAYLQSYAMKFNHNSIVVPTVVDMTYYNHEKDFSHEPSSAQPKPVTIGWMGSPSTAKSLQFILEALATVAKTHGVRFLFVGSGPLPFVLSNMTVKDWTEKEELSDILKMDIGIMPLEDNTWNKGKCGFKLIQYMACGVPVVGSPVGVNQSIIDHGINGFKATTAEEWVKSLTLLIESRDLRMQFGKSARRKIASEYSLNFTIPLIAGAIKALPLEENRK